MTKFVQKTMAQLTGRGADLNDHFGVEIEVEHRNAQFGIPDGHNDRWRLEGDGSLRHNGGEYVMRQPQLAPRAKQFVRQLAEHIDNTNEVLDTGRAGVHIHMNVSDLTVRQYVTLVCMWHMIEPIILNWCGEFRNGNLFCMPLNKAEYVAGRLAQALVAEEIGHLRTDEIRYAALNLKATPQYSSVEFRALPSDGDWDRITVMIDVLRYLKGMARQVDNPIQVVADVSARGHDEFVDSLLGVHAHMFEKYDGYERDMMESVRIAQRYAYCKEW